MGGTAACQPLPEGGTRFVVAIRTGTTVPV